MPVLHETIVPEDRIKRITVLISGSGSNLQAILDASLTEKLPNAQVTYVLSSRSNAYGLQRAAKATPPIPTSVCALKTFLNRTAGASRLDYDAEVARRVVESRPDIVVLAGWMHILSDSFLDILDGATPVPRAPALPPPTESDLKAAAQPHVPNSAELAKELLPSANASAGTELPAPPMKQRFPIPCINLHPALPGAFDGANAIGRAYAAFQAGEIKNTGCMVHRVIREVDRGEPLIVREVEIIEGQSLEQLEQRIHEVEHQIIVEGTKLILEELDAPAKTVKPVEEAPAKAAEAESTSLEKEVEKLAL